MGIKVLSLFDGMSCGMIAFKKIGCDIDEYYAYEIDKYAIKTSQHNFPAIIHHGDVFEGDFTQYEGFDYLIGGSPCTYWSIAQSSDRRETTASGLGWELFSQYVRALNEAKPKYFLYENNKSMSKDIYKSISDTFGFEPICINSALVSAQNRQRLYWVGKRNEDGNYGKVDIEQPKDRGILLKDVLDGLTDREKKGRAVIGSTGRTTEKEYFKKTQGNMTYEPVFNVKQVGALPRPNGNISASQGFRIYDINAKSVSLKGNAGGAGGKTGLYAVPVGVAQRGRYIDDNSTEQHIEVREDGKSNCLTTVQKDSLVCVPVHVNNYSKNELDSIPAEEYKELTDREMEYMVRDHSDRRWNFCQRPKQDDKAKCVVANIAKGVPYNVCAIHIEFENNEPTKAISSSDGKTYKVYKVQEGMIDIKGKTYPIKLCDGYYIIRKLTVNECKRLQTVPDWFEFPVSDTQAYKCLGNGWTIDVIVHLLEATIDNKGSDRND